jgi:hypothetical protein
MVAMDIPVESNIDLENLENNLNEAVKCLMIGLTTDGAEHKQWFLEQALLAICPEDYVAEAMRDIGWEPGTKLIYGPYPHLFTEGH